MRTRHSRFLAPLVLLVIALTGSTAIPAHAAGGDVRTVRVRVVMHGDPAMQQFRTTGSDGQIRYGNGMLGGAATIDGTAWQVELLGQVAYTDGAGPFRGYWTFTDPAGDTLVLDYRGKASVVEDTTRIRGTVDVLGGSGRLAEVTGRGKVSGVRRVDLGGDVEYTFTLKLRGLPTS